MTEERVRAECAKLGWQLDGPHNLGNGIAQWRMLANASWLRYGSRVVGAGSSPLSAYLNACHHEGITPF